MTRSIVAAALGAVALLGAFGSAAAQYPTEPPPPTPLRPLTFPSFGEARLANGLDIVVVENRKLPVVSVFLTVPAGAVRDPMGLEGMADMVATLLTKGTERRSAEEIAEAIEGIGGSLDAGAGNDFFTVSTTVLTEHLPFALDLLAEVVREPAFPVEELELARTQALSALQVQKSQPQAIASEFFAREVYGDHPYGRSASDASLGAISREAVRAFHREHLVPGGAVLVAAGDVDLEEIVALVEARLAGWSGSAAPLPEMALPPARETDILLVHRPGSDQSTVVVGNRALVPGDEDYYGAVVANRVLGGGTDARLFSILREERGWTYGAYSNVSRPKGVGRFQAGANTRPEVTDSALVELLAQVRRMQTEPVPAPELESAKGFLTGSFPLRIQTAQQVAQQVGNVKLLGLGDDYLETYLERLDAVDADAVTRAAQRVMQPDSAVVLVVGDGSRVYEPLAAIARVRVVDVDGNELEPAELLLREVALEIDPALVVARRDSFQVSFGGSAIGHQILETVREGDDAVFRIEVAIALAGISQNAEARFDVAAGAMRSYRQRATMQGVVIETDLSFDGNRVTGVAQSPNPGPAGMTVDTVEVDATVLPGVVDDQAVLHLLPALPLAAGETITVNVFNAVSGSIVPLSLAVTAAPGITVPAGTFDTWRVDITGGETPQVVYVSQGADRRIVKMELVGQPVSFELAGASP